MNEENQVYFVDSDKLPPAALESTVWNRIRLFGPTIWSIWRECRSLNQI